MKRLGLTVIVSALAVGMLVAPAAAKRGKDKSGKVKKVSFVGVLTAVSVDGDPATADSFTFRVIKANGPGRRWIAAHPGDVTAAITDRTRFKGPQKLGRTASDYRVGDGVKVKALAGEAGLVARKVKLRLQSYEGTVASNDGATMSVQWTDANKLARDWLAQNGSPNPVSLAITAATKLEREPAGDFVAGDPVEATARPAADGSGLEAVKVESAEDVSDE